MPTRAARPPWAHLPPLAAILAVTVLVTPLFAAKADAEAPPRANTRTEAWPHASTQFRAVTPATALTVVPATDARDGRALRLTLPANAQAGPNQGVAIASTKAYRYGTFSTRMRTAGCRDRTDGVVTGFFTYANDGTDRDGNGLTDNEEIDVEVLCADPGTAYLTIWTDYDEATGTGRSTGRSVKLGFDSSKAFHTYAFEWRADRVTFTVDGTTRWNYRGPRATIPDRAAPLMQNVWHTATWSPPGRTATGTPATGTTADIDVTTVGAAVRK